MSHCVEKGQDVVNAIVRCGSVRVLRKHHQVHVLCHKLMTPTNVVVDVLQPRLHRGLGCLSDVRALGQSDWLRYLRGLGPNKWVHPAEVVANLLLRLLQTALVHLLVEGIVLQKVAEDRLAVLLVHFRVPGLPSKHRSAAKTNKKPSRKSCNISLRQAPGWPCLAEKMQKTPAFSRLAA